MPIQKLSAWNNGWMKKETKISIRISVISRILHWLDSNRQSSPWDIKCILNYNTEFFVYLSLYKKSLVIAPQTTVYSCCCILDRHKRTVISSETEMAIVSSTGLTAIALTVSLWFPNWATSIPWCLSQRVALLSCSDPEAIKCLVTHNGLQTLESLGTKQGNSKRGIDKKTLIEEN